MSYKSRITTDDEIYTIGEEKTVFFQSCPNLKKIIGLGKTKSVNVHDCPNLTEIDAENGNFSLKSSGCSSLTRLHRAQNLEELTLHSCPVSIKSLGQMPNLKRLDISFSFTTQELVDVPQPIKKDSDGNEIKTPPVQTVVVHDFHSDGKITHRQFPSLEYLACMYTGIKEIDAKLHIKELNIEQSKVETVQDFQYLEVLFCDCSKITTISNLPKCTKIYAGRCKQLKTITGVPNLKFFENSFRTVYCGSCKSSQFCEFVMNGKCPTNDAGGKCKNVHDPLCYRCFSKAKTHPNPVAQTTDFDPTNLLYYGTCEMAPNLYKKFFKEAEKFASVTIE